MSTYGGAGMTTEEFDDLIQTLDYETAPYSGRGMHGKECLSIRLDSISKVIAAVANITAEADDGFWVADQFRKCRTDDLGKGVVLYFPHLSYGAVLGEREPAS